MTSGLSIPTGCRVHTHARATGGYVIAVSPRQQGNPVLKHIRNVPYEFVEGITPDYGASVRPLYRSIRVQSQACGAASQL